MSPRSAAGAAAALAALACLVFLWAAGAGAGAEAPAAGPGKEAAPTERPKPGFEKGPLQEVAKPVGKLLFLGWDEQRIRLDRESHDQYRVSDEEDGQIAYDSRRFQLTLSEAGAPERQLIFKDNGEGNVSIMLFGGDDDLFFRASQTKDGGFRVVHIHGRETFQGEAPSFAAFCRQHPDYARAEMLPLIRHLGVTLPPMPDDAAVRARALSRLRPLGADEKREAKGKANAGK